MPKLTFVSSTGESHVVDAPLGRSLMRAAVDANVSGIEAVCGGSCSCATCHVYVDESWMRVVGRATPLEENMLEFSDRKQPNSRLSCQVVVTDALDGLVVHLPVTQG
ncbi:2Fe-2S iron-sulfur cluster-binding protein [Steroidobacter sp.]|uniref:2Fe-2S iron-sulfur cluster-binding protein n=1 Tax=Steroidobacter sp. TaxID=1978227 RepID=UPI001A4757D9|nr:2Fe-2S iron-sulfur cluster-binding protein [Steroidobacter sp.]MBL8267614.1 2Fe-2S iron-sulfur cluster binding domain-containing protein [Steroidobacter sp.]